MMHSALACSDESAGRLRSRFPTSIGRQDEPKIDPYASKSLTQALPFSTSIFEGLLRPILGASWAHLGPVLGPSWALLGASWGHLVPILGHLGPILGSSWAILGSSWGHVGSCSKCSWVSLAMSSLFSNLFLQSCAVCSVSLSLSSERGLAECAKRLNKFNI